MSIDKDLFGSRVYVVGAGFSAGLGFPLTNELLALALARMHVGERDLIVKIIEFHFPYLRMLVVNPDAAAANRIRRVLGVDCAHYQTSVATWALSKKFSF